MVYPLAEKYLRISGKTVEELAEEVGTSRSTMYYKLNGGSDMSVEMAIKVKAALGAEESIEFWCCSSRLRSSTAQRSAY